MTDALGYAATRSLLNTFNALEPMSFKRRDLGPKDVAIQIAYCGVCHSDVHQVKNEWANTVWPCMPGHEIVGTVTQVGAAVTAHKVGDTVGVGCMIDSCGECRGCHDGLEQYCEGPQSFLATYNGYFKPADKQDPPNTFGGYSDHIIVQEHFVLRWPDGLDKAAGASLLCAGVTTYSPLKHFGVKAGWKVGVVGIGGLGHIAIKLAKAMGATVVAITETEAKAEDVARLGADAALLSTDKKAMEAQELSFDFILSTIPEKHDANPYLCLLKRDATLCVVGALEPLEPLDQMEIAFHRRSYTGSGIGSIAETQEVLDFCAQHGIAADIELIAIQDINKAYDRVEKGDVRYRFVIDMASLAQDSRENAKEAPDKQKTY